MAGKNGYVTEVTEGKRYRVRDKNPGKGKDYIVWAQDLSYEDAHVLKERICGLEKSRTARIEDMTIALEGRPVTPKGNQIVSLAEVTEAVVDAAAPLRGVRTSSLVTAPNHPDPSIADAQAKALAAARATAAQAQARAAQVAEQPPNGEIEVLVPDNIEDELDGLVDGEDLPA